MKYELAHLTFVPNGFRFMLINYSFVIFTVNRFIGAREIYLSRQTERQTADRHTHAETDTHTDTQIDTRTCIQGGRPTKQK